MSDSAERLQSARRKAGYSDATAAARAFGWNINTYRSHENSARGLRRDVAERYAKAFRVSAAWLLTGDGDDPMSCARAGAISVDPEDLRAIVSLLLRSRGTPEDTAADLADIVVECLSTPPLVSLDGDLVRSLGVRLELRDRRAAMPVRR